MLKKWKVLTILIALCAISFAVYEAYQRQFKLENIRLDSAESKLPVNSDELKLLQDVLSQPYTYLDRGKQSFVFLSQDQRYVLKFFDTRNLRPRYFSSEVRRSYKRKIARLITGYRTAFDHDRDHSGLLYVQLQPNPEVKLVVDLIDRFGFQHKINLGKVPFIVQQRAIPTRHLITAMLEKGNTAEAIQFLRKMIDMYMDEYQRGLFDRDHNFMHNTGFIDGQPVRIDQGRLKVDESFKDPRIFMPDLRKITIDRTGGWLSRHFPQYREEILSAMQTKLDEISFSEKVRSIPN